MDSSKTQHRYGYDIFISHNRADKAWVRKLADQLASEQHNGRALRPWLDERFLDPGELGSNAELTTAMDRSRFFGLVLSPAAVASKWVNFEIDYFLTGRDAAEMIPMLKEECAIPAPLKDSGILDFRNHEDQEGRLAELLARLCPPGAATPDDARSEVDEVFDALLADEPGGFAAGPTPARDALLAEISRHNIDDPDAEGLALAAFLRAAERLQNLQAQCSEHTDNLKMLLGECLAVALLRTAGYRQVVQRLIDLQDDTAADPVLFFVTVRAFSKLAERDPALIDASALLRLASELDRPQHFGNHQESIAVLLGRVAGKLRGTDLGDLLIRTLSEAGPASRIAAASAISLSQKRAAPVYYLSALDEIQRELGQQGPTPVPLPSRKLLALLFGLELDQPAAVRRRLDLARTDIRQDFGIDDFPYGYTWFNLRDEQAATHLHHAPFIGTVRKATLGNMEDLAGGVNVSDIVCLTEPRIVDALFNHCGALLILDQDTDSPQCRRLRNRGVPFGVCSQELMSTLSDGCHIVVDADRSRVLKSAG